MRFILALCPLCLLAGCIQSNPRSSGAHDICVTVNGSNNHFNLHTERQASGQTADNKGGGTLTPAALGDSALKAASVIATGGTAAASLASTKIVETLAKPDAEGLSEVAP
jgi:hypothetical protein